MADLPSLNAGPRRCRKGPDMFCLHACNYIVQKNGPQCHGHQVVCMLRGPPCRTHLKVHHHSTCLRSQLARPWIQYIVHRVRVGWMYWTTQRNSGGRRYCGFCVSWRGGFFATFFDLFLHSPCSTSSASRTQRDRPIPAVSESRRRVDSGNIEFSPKFRLPVRAPPRLVRASSLRRSSIISRMVMFLRVVNLCETRNKPSQ